MAAAPLLQNLAPKGLASVAAQQAVFSLYLGISFAPNHKGMPFIESATAAGAAAILTDCSDQSLVSLAHGVMIRTRREPKFTTRAVSPSTSMTRPRPYVSWVT